MRKQSSNITNLAVIWSFFLSLFLPRDIVSINQLTLIVNIISQRDIKHFMTLLIYKNITSVLKVFTNITSITTRPIGLAAILLRMSVLTFKTDILNKKLLKCLLINLYIFFFFIESRYCMIYISMINI